MSEELKVFVATREDEADYEEYDGFVVVAKDSRQAKKIINDTFGIEDHPWKIKRDKLDKPSVLLASFKPG